MYLLDTNSCIFAINNKSRNMIEHIKEHMQEGIFISSLTVAELEYGVSFSDFPEKNRLALTKFLTPFTVLNFDDADAIAYGRLKAELRSSGTLFGPIDMLLAGQALSKKLIFVTNNTSEFSKVKNLELQDWK